LSSLINLRLLLPRQKLKTSIGDLEGRYNTPLGQKIKIPCDFKIIDQPSTKLSISYLLN